MEIDRPLILEGAKILRSGGLVVFPTETVFGLGANAEDPSAVRRIFSAKGRPQDNPLIVHVSSVEHLSLAGSVIDGPNMALFRAFSPGPLTVIVPRGPNLAPETTGGLETVGIRIPSHPVARALLDAAGIPVAAPSANRSGRPSPTTTEMARSEMDGRVDLILPGTNSIVGLESTIVYLENRVAHILRPGAIGIQGILRVLTDAGYHFSPDKASSHGPVQAHPDTPVDRAGAQLLPRAPGTRYRHYSPQARVHLWLGAGSIFGERVGLILPVPLMEQLENPVNAQGGRVVYRGRVTNAQDYGQNLYRYLIEADKAGATDIWLWLIPSVEPIDPGAGLTEALRDRCRRAAGLLDF